MKYNETNKPLVCMQTQSRCYKNTKPMTVKGVLWHSTGANNPNLKRYIQPSDNAPDKDQMIKLLGKNNSQNDWNHTDRAAGLNCWIGKLANGTVATVQTMPWNYRPWGCGAHPSTNWSCNDGWIQFEICESDLNDPIYFEAVYTEACEITAYLCKMFNIDPLGTVKFHGVDIPTITCHNDAYKLKHAGGHSDINHWFPKFGKSMETARHDVTLLLNSTTIQEDDDMITQEQFNQMMNTYLAEQVKKPCSYAEEQAAMEWAKSIGLIKGDETGNTMPKKTLTRGEMAILLQRFSQMNK